MSAVTCKICVDWFGVENVKVVFINAANNEHEDTYRFKRECEQWYGCDILTIRNNDYNEIKDVWYDSLSLNLAKGAKCSAELKTKVRQHYIKIQDFSYQAFGYDLDELNRAKDMLKSNPHLNPIFPVIASGMDKKACIKMIQKANDMFLKIRIPVPYTLGLNNNNCWNTGCVQGGIGYWQWMRDNQLEKFDAMAVVEHELTDLKGEPVTMLKDQSEGGGLVFLKPHPKYPDMKDISMMKGRPPEPLVDCNGFCKTENEPI